MECFCKWQADGGRTGDFCTIDFVLLAPTIWVSSSFLSLWLDLISLSAPSWVGRQCSTMGNLFFSTVALYRPSSQLLKLGNQIGKVSKERGVQSTGKLVLISAFCGPRNPRKLLLAWLCLDGYVLCPVVLSLTAYACFYSHFSVITKNLNCIIWLPWSRRLDELYWTANPSLTFVLDICLMVTFPFIYLHCSSPVLL